MNYLIIRQNNAIELESAVNKAIRDGFEPIGSIAIDYADYFYQAMIKKTGSKIKEIPKDVLEDILKVDIREGMCDVSDIEKNA